MAKKKQKTAANDLSSLFEKLGVQIPRNSGKIYDEDLKTYIPAFLKEENSPMNIKTFNEINKRLDEFSLFSTYIPDANFVEKKEEKNKFAKYKKTEPKSKSYLKKMKHEEKQKEKKKPEEEEKKIEKDFQFSKLKVNEPKVKDVLPSMKKKKEKFTLKQAINRENVLKQLKGTAKGEEKLLAEKIEDAFKKAAGEKVPIRDAKILKKRQKRALKLKEKRKKKWEERVKTLEEEQKERKRQKDENRRNKRLRGKKEFKLQQELKKLEEEEEERPKKKQKKE